jgi:GAF domain/PilZ domain/Sel1 repeat
MSATLQSPSHHPALENRRRRVRQKVHAPAYATFHGGSKGRMLDLYEVLDISEIGVAVQCPTPMEPNQEVNLCLDLAEAAGQIMTRARVVWSNGSGRVGLGFSQLREADLRRLKQWLFLNAMAGAANAKSTLAQAAQTSALRPNYTDTLSAVSAIQREAESLGSDIESVLGLVTRRSMSLLRASGAAIALAGKDAGTMVCRASIGISAPPIGATLQIGSGFSGDCVRTGNTLLCDDSDTDPRVDPQSCRMLGIRSMLASPIRAAEKVVGLIEAFSAEPSGFCDQDAVILQRFAETISGALGRVGSSSNVSSAASAKSLSSAPGSVLFAKLPEQNAESTAASDIPADEDKVGGIRLPRTHLYLLILAAATVALALGFILAPWIQEKLHARTRNIEPTVLAFSTPIDASQSSSSNSRVETADFHQLLQMANQGNATAENTLGLLYAQGDEKQSIKQDETQAANWFMKAAEHGSVPAQYKLGLLYWGGHGVPKDMNKAYFWTVLARAGGQEGSQDLAKVLANVMTRAQATAIEQQAEIWYQQHQSQLKPTAAR